MQIFYATAGDPKSNGAPISGKDTAKVLKQPMPQQGRIPLPIIIAAVLIIAVIALVFYVSGHQSGLASKLVAGKTYSATEIGNVVMAYYNSTPQLQANYTGKVGIAATGSSGGGLQFTAPVEIEMMKYGKDSRASAEAQGVPIIGNLSFTSISENGTTYYFCLKSSFSLAISNTSGQQPYRCTKYNGGLGELLNNSSKGLAAAQTHQFGLLNSTIMGLEDYHGQQCVLVTSAGNIIINNSVGLGAPGVGQQNTSYSLSACLSNQYAIPLNISLRITEPGMAGGGLSASLSLNETYISTNTTESAVLALPGPVVNSSISAVSGLGGTTTIPGYGYNTTYPFNTTIYPYNTTYPFNTTIYPYNTTTQNVSATGSSANGTSCGSYSLSSNNYSASVNGTCSWPGGTLMVYAGGGNSGAVSIKIIGLAAGTLYYSKTTNNRCIAPLGSVQLPAQSYVINIRTGRGGGSCGPAALQLTSG